MDEDTWREIFENEMQDRGILDLWDFSVEENFQAQKGWLQYSLCCFARFYCSICGRNWASSKVHLLFRMKLKMSFGQVKMQIFRQKCKVCNYGEYEEPIILVDNAEVAIKCLVTRICQKFYKLAIEDFPKNFVKDGVQDGPHDRDNCEACSKGICNYVRSQENKLKQQTKPYPNSINTTKIPVSQHQQSYDDIQEDIRPYRILSYSPYVPQHQEASRYSREEVGQRIKNRSVPQHEPQSNCCCIIL